MKVILFIDTINNKEMTVALKLNGEEIVERKPLDTRKAQVVLPMLEEMLQKNKLELKDLTRIEVNPGPGSFTGIRVGLSIANILGFLLQIPVNNKKIGEPAEARY